MVGPADWGQILEYLAGQIKCEEAQVQALHALVYHQVKLAHVEDQ
jgi:hypothetical protein